MIVDALPPVDGTQPSSAVVSRLRRGLEDQKGSLVVWLGPTSPGQIEKLKLKQAVRLIGGGATGGVLAMVGADLVRIDVNGEHEMLIAGVDDTEEAFSWFPNQKGDLLGVRQRWVPSSRSYDEVDPQTEMLVILPRQGRVWSQSIAGKLRGVWSIGNWWTVALRDVGLIAIAPGGGIRWSYRFITGALPSRPDALTYTGVTGGVVAVGEEEVTDFARRSAEELLTSGEVPLGKMTGEVDAERDSGWVMEVWPATLGGNVFSFARRPEVKALDFESGETLWDRSFSWARTAPETVAGGSTSSPQRIDASDFPLAVDTDGQRTVVVFAAGAAVLDAATGEERTRFSLRDPVSGTRSGTVRALLIDGDVLLSTPAGSQLYDADGTQRWSVNFRPTLSLSPWGPASGVFSMGKRTVFGFERSVGVVNPDGSVTTGVTNTKASWAWADDYLVAAAGRDVAWYRFRDP